MQRGGDLFMFLSFYVVFYLEYKPNDNDYQYQLH